MSFTKSAALTGIAAGCKYSSHPAVLKRDGGFASQDARLR